MANDDNNGWYGSLGGAMLGVPAGIALVHGAPSVLHSLGAPFAELPFAKVQKVSAGKIAAAGALGAVLGAIVGHHIAKSHGLPAHEGQKHLPETLSAPEPKQWTASVKDDAAAVAPQGQTR